MCVFFSYYWSGIVLSVVCVTEIVIVVGNKAV